MKILPSFDPAHTCAESEAGSETNGSFCYRGVAGATASISDWPIAVNELENDANFKK